MRTSVGRGIRTSPKELLLHSTRGCILHSTRECIPDKPTTRAERRVSSTACDNLSGGLSYLVVEAVVASLLDHHLDCADRVRVNHRRLGGAVFVYWLPSVHPPINPRKNHSGLSGAGGRESRGSGQSSGKYEHLTAVGIQLVRKVQTHCCRSPVSCNYPVQGGLISRWHALFAVRTASVEASHSSGFPQNGINTHRHNCSSTALIASHTKQSKKAEEARHI